MNRNEVVRFRLTKMEKEVLKLRANKCSLSLSDFCRNTIFDKEVKYKLTLEEVQAYQSLARFHNDFERLANFFKHKDSILSNEVRKVAHDLHNELKKFQ